MHAEQAIVVRLAAASARRTPFRRHQLRPVIETGAAAMNSTLNRKKNTGSA